MASVYPTPGGSSGSWGTETRAFHGETRDLATGKIKVGALKASAMTGSEDDRVVADKGYVGVATNGDTPVLVDSESNALDFAHAYLAQTSGFINAYGQGTSGLAMRGYVGDTIDPEGAGVQVAHSSADGIYKIGISFFVPNGKYFEITINEVVSGDAVVWTPLVTGGAAPIDQD